MRRVKAVGTVGDRKFWVWVVVGVERRWRKRRRRSSWVRQVVVADGWVVAAAAAAVVVVVGADGTDVKGVPLPVVGYDKVAAAEGAVLVMEEASPLVGWVIRPVVPFKEVLVDVVVIVVAVGMGSTR